jgi:hypothetical protein
MPRLYVAYPLLLSLTTTVFAAALDGVALGSTKEVAMTKKSDTDQEELKDDPPGPADHGRDGGMATRENAPELTKPDRDD